MRLYVKIKRNNEQKVKDMEPFILASASPRRKELLQLTDLEFIIQPSMVDEIITKEKPEDVVLELASQKAWDVWKQTGGCVIGADTVVAYDEKILGKPVDEADAVRMLTMLSDDVHQVYTGVSIIFAGKEKTFFQKTEVEFYPLKKETILKYVQTGEPMDKAGAYGIQGKAAVFVKSIQGDYYNVVGFPIARFVHELEKMEDENTVN